MIDDDAGIKKKLMQKKDGTCEKTMLKWE